MALLFDSLLLDLSFVLFSMFVALYVYVTKNFNFWTKNGVPHLKPAPFVGNFKDVVLLKKQVWQCLQNLYREHRDKPYLGIFAFDQPVLLVFDLDLVKKVLTKDAHVFVNRTFVVDEERDPLVCRNVFTLQGQQWQDVRTKLTPIFTSEKIQNMFYLLENCARQLDSSLDRYTADDCQVQVKDMVQRFTTDVIASCAFGAESNSLKNPGVEFRRHVRDITKPTFRKVVGEVMAVFCPNLMKMFKIQIIDKHIADFMKFLVWNTVEHRVRNAIVRKDFLDSMTELRKKEKQRDDVSDRNTGFEGIQDSAFRIDGDNFVAQVLVFLTAGFETSSTTLTIALYELALHPDMQHRLRREISDVLNEHNQEVTYDAIQEMKYLDMVVSETLRKYPVVPFLGRYADSDYRLADPSGTEVAPVMLRKGTAVFIPVAGIHHDPQYYPDPDKFDPERFTDENKKKRPAFTYLPFGDGPRNCIGMQFGLMQVKTGLIHILSRYEVEPCKDTPVPLVFDMSLALVPKGEVPLSFKKVTK